MVWLPKDLKEKEIELIIKNIEKRRCGEWKKVVRKNLVLENEPWKKLVYYLEL